ncbi:MAG: hypothetical protein ACI8UR_000484 [Natronomonas sp.]|jgi:hypothetical protein
MTIASFLRIRALSRLPGVRGRPRCGDDYRRTEKRIDALRELEREMET